MAREQNGRWKKKQNMQYLKICVLRIFSEIRRAFVFHDIWCIIAFIDIDNEEDCFDMKKILFVNACVRPESRTYILARHVLEKLGGEIEVTDLEREEISPLNLSSLQLRDMYVREKNFSHEIFKYARQFAQADKIVVAAPYWDMSFPAMVKAYFEAITVQGLTFHYTKEGIPEGLCSADKLIYVTTAGGSIGDANYGFEYVDACCRTFYGIKDTVCYKAEFLDVIGADVKGIIRKALEEIDEDFQKR